MTLPEVYYFCDIVAKAELETRTAIIDKEVVTQGFVPIEQTSLKEDAINADFLGVSGSFLCLIHCLAPQLLALGTVGLGIGSFFAGQGWVLFFWVTCLLAVWQSARKSLFIRSSLFLWFAFLLFTTGILLEEFGGFDHWVSYIGSSFLISGHLYNLHLQKKWKQVLLSIKK